jgi:hypothetical protein
VNAVTGYANSGGAHIAYTIAGAGSIDVLMLSAYTIAAEEYANEPHAAAYDRRLASFCRLIRFDQRGIGLSDPLDLNVGARLGDTAIDMLAVLDAVGSDRVKGDRAWRARLENHDAIVRRELRRYGGREVNTTGDGFFAAFGSPTQAVRCARSIVDASGAAQLDVRAGIHTGECEQRGGDLAGLAVHIAARVAAAAGAGEVIVSRTVRDLVGGSEMRFVDRGEHGAEGRARTLAAVRAGKVRMRSGGLVDSDIR